MLTSVECKHFLGIQTNRCVVHSRSYYSLALYSLIFPTGCLRGCVTLWGHERRSAERWTETLKSGGELKKQLRAAVKFIFCNFKVNGFGASEFCCGMWCLFSNWWRSHWRLQRMSLTVSVITKHSSSPSNVTQSSVAITPQRQQKAKRFFDVPWTCTSIILMCISKTATPLFSSWYSISATLHD